MSLRPHLANWSLTPIGLNWSLTPIVFELESDPNCDPNCDLRSASSVRRKTSRQDRATRRMDGDFVIFSGSRAISFS